MKEIHFNPNGEKLNVNIEMQGLYFITYTYQLWASTNLEPPVVTSPIRSGSNESPHDDSYPVKSDYLPNENVERNNDRVVDVRFWIKKAGEDNGYRLTIAVYQGDIAPANEIGREIISGTVGTASIKEEFSVLKLKV